MTSPDVSAEDGEGKNMGLKEAHPQSVEVSGQKSVSLLSDEELRLQIAELFGWTWQKWGKDSVRIQAPLGYQSNGWRTSDPENCIYWPANGRSVAQVKHELIDAIPDYCHDLNAMHEAEKSSGFHAADSPPALDYWITLGRVVSKPIKEPGKTFTTLSEIDRCSATARQRAEAFVLTMQASDQR